MEDFNIKVVNDPPFIDTFEQVYGTEFSSYPLERVIRNKIKEIYRKFTGIYPEGEDYDADEDDIPLSELSDYFLV